MLYSPPFFVPEPIGAKQFHVRSALDDDALFGFVNHKSQFKDGSDMVGLPHGAGRTIATEPCGYCLYMYIKPI
jgi:hypothetical protein